MLIKKYILSGGMLLLLLACTGKKDKLNPENTLTDSAGLVTGVRLSEKEAVQAGIRFGTFSHEVHERILECRGDLIAAPGDRSYLVTPASGRVVTINCHPGQYLKTGSAVAHIENSDFIILQQEYLEMKNQLEYLQEEYTRQGELAVENATSLKKMQVAKRDYHSVELKMKALQLQLEMLGINVDSLSRSGISPVIPVQITESGTVARVLMTREMYINKGERLIELHKTSSVTARLKVAEAYANRIKINQPVAIFLASDSLTPIHLKVSSVTREIDAADRCAIAYVNMPGKDYIYGMSVMARINMGADSMRLIPSRSLLANHFGYYVFAKESGIIRRLQVQKGSTYNGFCEIKGIDHESADSLVIEGAEYLRKNYIPF
ncbi:MAG: efflux RND transporter periplasmic adaptor subunit [Bacteroidales bacterium]|nr:efflux RND transporter periplasmic adaptor subunit [Bacteroidales bacterium]